MFFKITPTFDENQASVNGYTEEEENAAEKTADDADKNSEENEIIHKKKKVLTIEQGKKPLEYQETMDLDIGKIASTNQQIWRSIYEVTHGDYFKVVNLFPREF